MNKNTVIWISFIILFILSVLGLVFLNNHFRELNAIESEYTQPSLQVITNSSNEIIQPQNTDNKKEFNIFNHSKQFTVEATGYANTEECCYPYFDGKTSIGRDANFLGVAVDPKVIPYGSLIEIEGLGIFIADDCGGDIKGKKIDIRFESMQKAKEWGRKTIQIKVYNFIYPEQKENKVNG